MASTVGTIPKPVRMVEGKTASRQYSRVAGLRCLCVQSGRKCCRNSVRLRHPVASEIHGAISYYLHNKTAVDRYLERKRIEFEKRRAEDRARPNHITREMLLARKSGSDKNGVK